MIKKIFSIIGIVILFSIVATYFILVSDLKEKGDRTIMCQNITVTILDSLQNRFVSKKEVKDILGEYPWKKEGYTNGEWVLVDFSSIVVHVFQREARDFYNIEGLWADAETTVIEDDY